jgi:nicotinate-nucleotide pyrophosphorylase (carboxylating)
MDIRDEVFRSLRDREVLATLEAADEGIVAGMEAALARAATLDIEAEAYVSDGDAVREGDAILGLRGSAKALAMAEESLIGILAKTSGIASATRRLVEAAGELLVVGGAWKKVPPEIRSQVRHAIEVGGASGRMAEHPMVYLDKNYVRMLGGVQQALEAVRHLADHRKVIQLPGEEQPLAEEARIAAELGADTVFVDTGNPSDLKPVIGALERMGRRDAVTVAFGGGVTLKGLALLKELGADALCIGRSIVDAPLLDMRLSVRDVRPRFPRVQQ